MISVGDRVTHSDPYHFRGASIGLVEAVNWIEDLTIYWLNDGDNQRHPAHRSYPPSELKKVSETKD